jgi:hypothetical protein
MELGAVMGTFRIEVQAVGGHGCQRHVKSGSAVGDCGEPTCVDCIGRRFVKALKDAGASFSTYGGIESVGYAKLTHWPHGHGTVTDDLLSGIRSGEF